ncbi:MAG: hypothetical protein VX777_01280 [Chlamydiota bacterium]|nr:hypothetical protein [Chlamydiota bacterium]
MNNTTALNSAINEVLEHYYYCEAVMRDDIEAKKRNYQITRVVKYQDRIIQISLNRNPDIINLINQKLARFNDFKNLMFDKYAIYSFKNPIDSSLPPSKFKPTKISVAFPNNLQSFDTKSGEEFLYIVKKLREGGLGGFFYGRQVVCLHKDKKCFFEKYIAGGTTIYHF